MNKVYIINMGQANKFWSKAKANHTIATYSNLDTYPFWRAGDRDGFVAKAITHTLTGHGKRPSKQVAGRWYNLTSELRDSEGDLWITRQGPDLWWTISKPDDLKGTLVASDNISRDGPQVWLLEKPCQQWSNKDEQGRRLLWDSLHPKAKDFLATQATLQSIQNDRGYADYVRALINGKPLDQWHNLPLFKKKQGSATKVFSSKEKAAARMAQTMLQTVAQSNGQITESKVKEKNTSLSRSECEALLLRKMEEQGHRCALTGLPLEYNTECSDREMLASLDRIDSNGHYTPDNIQIVCRFMNRWKGADPDDEVRRLLMHLRDHYRAE